MYEINKQKWLFHKSGDLIMFTRHDADDDEIYLLSGKASVDLWSSLEAEYNFEEIVTTLSSNYDCSEEILIRDTANALELLVNADIITEQCTKAAVTIPEKKSITKGSYTGIVIKKYRLKELIPEEIRTITATGGGGEQLSSDSCMSCVNVTFCMYDVKLHTLVRSSLL
ncbi:MAG: PqqD family protein [Planctomycetes bacterium]|nr:PqqD family protein [Planctomycetota bacterium]